MTDVTKLNDMLNNIIDGNEEQAQVDFHAYLTDKMKEVIHNNDIETEE